MNKGFVNQIVNTLLTKDSLFTFIMAMCKKHSHFSFIQSIFEVVFHFENVYLNCNIYQSNEEYLVNHHRIQVI